MAGLDPAIHVFFDRNDRKQPKKVIDSEHAKAKAIDWKKRQNGLRPRPCRLYED